MTWNRTPQKENVYYYVEICFNPENKHICKDRSWKSIYIYIYVCTVIQFILFKRNVTPSPKHHRSQVSVAFRYLWWATCCHLPWARGAGRYSSWAVGRRRLLPLPPVTPHEPSHWSRQYPPVTPKPGRWVLGHEGTPPLIRWFISMVPVINWQFYGASIFGTI